MAEADTASARWLVAGRVQGVGFRWFVQREARSLHLVGWASNLPDGRVEVCAAGSPAALATLALALARGPGLAAVCSVEKLEAPPEMVDVKSFHVR